MSDTRRVSKLRCEKEKHAQWLKQNAKDVTSTFILSYFIFSCFLLLFSVIYFFMICGIKGVPAIMYELCLGL